MFLPPDILTGAKSWKPLPRPPTPEPEPGPVPDSWSKTPPPLEPTLAGEDTGEWLCHGALIGKRLDVVLEGIATYNNRKIKNSPKWQGLNGKTGVLVQVLTPENRRVHADSLETKKVKLYHPGSPTANPVDVPPTTIRPRRTLDGTSITLVMQRVVIVGPGCHAELPENIGRYGQTRPDPDTQAAYGGPNFVRVQIEGGDSYVYHISSLCLSLNKALLESSVSVF